MSGPDDTATTRSPFTLRDLARRFEGWEVASVILNQGLAEVRLRGSIENAPRWVTAAGVLYVACSAINPGGTVGKTLALSENGIEIGGWSVRLEELVAGRLLDTAVVLVPPEMPSPLTEPSLAAAHIVNHGLLAWPSVADLAEEHRGLDLLAGITRLACSAPSLVVSVESEPVDEPGTRWDLLATPVAAVEIGRHSADPVSVSYFPISDIPSRVLERAGLAGDDTPTRDGTGTARVTYRTDEALVTGALEWVLTPEGAISGDGPVSVTTLASELIRMLPGGDPAQSDKEAVGKQ